MLRAIESEEDEEDEPKQGGHLSIADFINNKRQTQQI